MRISAFATEEHLVADKRVKVGYVNGEFRAWVLCPACRARIYLDLAPAESSPTEQKCECGAVVQVPARGNPAGGHHDVK
jgi:hypothetical protein